MAKKPSRKTLKTKADKLFSERIRSEGRCEWCDATTTLQCCHIFTRRYLVTRWDHNNALCLCSKCHFKGHEQPLEFAEFVKRLYGGKKYNALRRKAKTSIKKIDLQVIVDKYTKLLKGQI